MISLTVTYVLGFVVLAGVGLLIAFRPVPAHALRTVDLSPRRAARALAVAVLGVAITLGVGLPLGYAARALGDPVDLPVFDWVNSRVGPSVLTSVNELLTQMGNAPQTKMATAVGAVVLAPLWRRRWFVPPIVLGIVFFTQKYTLRLLGAAVHRGHPPTTLGTYPSGGCARLIAIYGTILCLLLIPFPRLTRRWKTAAWTALALAAWAEAFSRVYLAKHWITDVIGGLAVGAALLGTVIVALRQLLAARPASRGHGRLPLQSEDATQRDNVAMSEQKLS